MDKNWTSTQADTHTDTIHQIKINCIVIRLFTSQVMDSQVDSETLNNLLENDMISLNGGESDIDLLGSDPYTNSREDMRNKKIFQSWMNYWPAHQYTAPLTPLSPPHLPPSTPLSQLIHFDINLPLPHCPLPQDHYHQTHPTMYHLHQCTHIRHPLPQQNPNPHRLTYNPSICHSPSISSQVTRTTSQNLNYYAYCQTLFRHSQ